jgi:hypothetical protein
MEKLIADLEAAAPAVQLLVFVLLALLVLSIVLHFRKRPAPKGDVCPTLRGQILDLKAAVKRSYLEKEVESPNALSTEDVEMVNDRLRELDQVLAQLAQLEGTLKKHF